MLVLSEHLVIVKLDWFEWRADVTPNGRRALGNRFVAFRAQCPPLRPPPLLVLGSPTR